jgi:D-arabinose 1-dehydrogenase-like Zn-dependent alcohol dehydrogenase
MKAAVVTEFNAPWQLRDLADVHPAPGQVLIRVRASGMCGTDLHVHHGLFPLKPPFVAGHEPTGDVVELGAGVTDLQVGDRVGVFWNQKGCGRCAVCQRGMPARCSNSSSWMNLGGGNSELMLAWASGCQLLPEGVSYEDAAPIFCAGYTVMSGLRNATPKPGERIAVLGVGGLGHLALQLSKAVGLETFAITGQADKRAELKGFGADDVVVVDAAGDVGARLNDLGGVDVVLSTTNLAPQIASAMNGLRPGGRLVNMGLTSEPIAVNALPLLLGQRELRGSSQDERSDLAEALAFVASGKVKPKLETYPLARINDVRERLAEGKVRYRAVLLHAS